jgi:hypothetical protein
LERVCKAKNLIRILIKKENDHKSQNQNRCPCRQAEFERGYQQLIFGSDIDGRFYS